MTKKDDLADRYGPDHTSDKGTLYEQGRRWHSRALRAEAISAELLEALNLMVGWVDDLPQDFRVYPAGLEEARAAIAKAESDK